ncbi:phosphate metabolism protein 7 [Didymosphaeria variabile]|uniref:Phosphate metabolism protein 7 n=1 Tax=Didymosphaeria variabile TaxID=1932322 RepID=A0A9W8XIG6_9PLEO|nr:phosphate metabolism protein 7 [Didymosphaeria variabile]KAJ4349996.1 phosphate metabolism protein 7 [Didymosphaeria variabile]
MAFVHLFSRDEGVAGSNRDEPQDNSLSGLVSTLVPTAISALVFVTLFLIFRRHFRRLYAPRTYIDSLGDQRKTPAPGNGLFAWIADFRRIKDEYILDHQSIDGYLFVRFFKVLIVLCFLGCVVTWPILFPINATGGAGKKQLNLLSMSNVANVNRYYAHALVSFVFLGLVMLIIARESFFVVNLRQAYRRSPWGASRLSSKTILFTNVPKNITQATLFELFPGVKHAWVASNCKELQELIDDRDKTALKLEAGEIQLSRDANQNRIKTDKGKKAYKAGEGIDHFCNPKDRPTHRLKFLVGKKVDTITYGRQHLAELIPKIEAEQDKHWQGKADLVGAVFLEFDTQRSAQDAWLLMQKRKTKPNSKMSARQLGVLPQEVVWNNLRIGTAEHWIRWIAATAFVSVGIIFFAIPVAVVGIISNINYLTQTFTWLEWINSIPTVILGVVTGLLPVVMLAVLMALVPIICRLMAKLAGWVTLSQVELQTQSWYFAFQVIQVFLVTTCASAATAVIQQVRDDPGKVLTLLSENLPKASNFYISYFILFGLSSAAGTLLNIGGFIGVVLLGRILPGKTPRKIWQKLVNLSAPAWGSEFPKWTNLGVIALTYSGIAPLVLGFATVGFSLIYIAFRYNFLYCYETNIDTQGGAYQRALRQLITGVYLSEGCLIGLFAIATGNNKAAAGPLAIECLLLALTIIGHLCLRTALVHHEARVAYTDPTPATTELEHGLAHTATPEKNTAAADSSSPNVAPKPTKIPGFLQKIINPERNSTPVLSSKLDQFYHQPQEPLPVEIAKRAYFNPAVTSPTPILWIVHDDMGISAREVRDTKKEVSGLEITDDQAYFNEKNKVEWRGRDEGKAREAPVWEERIIY